MRKSLLALVAASVAATTVRCASAETLAFFVANGTELPMAVNFAAAVPGQIEIDLESLATGHIASGSIPAGFTYWNSGWHEASVGISVGMPWYDVHEASIQAVPDLGGPDNAAVSGNAIFNGPSPSGQTYPVMRIRFGTPYARSVGFWLYSEVPGTSFEINVNSFETGVWSPPIGVPNDGSKGTVEGFYGVVSCDAIAEISIYANTPVGSGQLGLGHFAIDGLVVGFIDGPVQGDLNWDGVVDSADIAILLGNWGDACASPFGGAGDHDGDGAINAQDLGWLLGKIGD